MNRLFHEKMNFEIVISKRSNVQNSNWRILILMIDLENKISENIDIEQKVDIVPSLPIELGYWGMRRVRLKGVLLSARLSYLVTTDSLC